MLRGSVDKMLNSVRNYLSPKHAGPTAKAMNDILFDGLEDWVVAQDRQTRCSHCHEKNKDEL